MLKLYVWLTERMHSTTVDSERGAAAVEYGLLVALIALAVVIAVYWLGMKTNGIFCEVVTKLPFGPNDCTAAIPAAP